MREKRRKSIKIAANAVKIRTWNIWIQVQSLTLRPLVFCDTKGSPVMKTSTAEMV